MTSMALQPSGHVTDREPPNVPSGPSEALSHIDEPIIARVVHEFYHRVRRDPILGEIFNARITDWESHLHRMCEFWSSIALGSGRYHGRPLSKHLTLPVSAPHFDRWLEIFASTVQEIFTPDSRRAARTASTTYRTESRGWNRECSWNGARKR